MQLFDRISNLSSLPKSFANHPLSKDELISSYFRFFKHQISIRFRDEIIYPWIGASQLAIGKWMPGATGNIYSGLQEFSDMGFILHFTRSEDVFFDVGANVGVYTVLASKVCGARSFCFEPDPAAFVRLQRNIEVNDIADLTKLLPYAVGEISGTARFSVGLDVLNHLVEGDDPNSREVSIVRLDEFADNKPTIIKIDVEGFEDQVIAGAREVIQQTTLGAMLVENANKDIVEVLNSAGMIRAYYDPNGRVLGREPNGYSSLNSLFIRDFDACEKRLNSAPPFFINGRKF